MEEINLILRQKVKGLNVLVKMKRFRFSDAIDGWRLGL